MSNAIKNEIPELSEITKLDIILEKTPVKDSTVDGSFKIWNIRKNRSDDLPEQLTTQIEYLTKYPQAYIFTSPKFYKQLEEKLNDQTILVKIIERVNA